MAGATARRTKGAAVQRQLTAQEQRIGEQARITGKDVANLRNKRFRRKTLRGAASGRGLDVAR